MNDCIRLLLTSGTGPKECALAVAGVLQRLKQQAGDQGLSVEIIQRLAYDKHLRKQDLIEADAYRSVVVEIRGKSAPRFAQPWLGSILWLADSPLRPLHKRNRWFIAIKTVELEEEIGAGYGALESQVSFEACRAGGPGGQHVNKTNSAVRLYHKPSGIALKVESERSQHQNKRLAIQRLAALLALREQEMQAARKQQSWQQHKQLERGKPVKVFRGHNFE